MKFNLLVLSFIISTGAIAQVTVSGISSGAFMAQQMGVIYSKQISGIGSVAGGFFFCAQNHMREKILEGKKNLFLGKKNLFLFQQNKSLFHDFMLGHFLYPGFYTPLLIPSPANPIYQSVGICMQNPTLAKLPDLEKFEKNGWIDPVDYIRQQKIYLYHGQHDRVVNFEMMSKTVEFFEKLKVPNEFIKTDFIQFAGHTYPTDKKDLNACMDQKFPYISSCNKNLALDMMSFLTSKNLESTEINTDNLYLVDQTINQQNIHLANPEKGQQPTPSVGPYGYLYGSEKCLNNPENCQIHVALHGCEMSDSFDLQFDRNYTDQVQKTQIVDMRTEKSKIPGLKSLPYLKQKKMGYGTLKFALLSGYAELSEKNDILFLFPQTWITEKNYPYNPKGCWDWFGATSEDYATKLGPEPQWLMTWISSVQKNPRSYLIKQKPKLKSL